MITKASVSVDRKDLDTTSLPATDLKSTGFHVYGARETARIRNFQVSLTHP